MRTRPPRLRLLARLAPAALSLGGALFLLLRVGYSSGIGIHTQYLLPVFRTADPGFASGDWFVEETTPYHYGFQFLGTLAHRVDALDAFLFFWHLVSLLALASALLGWIRHLVGASWTSPRVLGGYLIGLVAVYAGIHEGWGLEPTLSSVPSPGFLATGLTLWCWLFGLQRRRLPAAVLLAGVTYAHVGAGVVAAIGLVLLLVGEAWSEGKSLRSVARRWAMPAVLFTAMVAPLTAKVLADFGGTMSAEAYRTFFYGRSPHHYAPHLGGAALHARSLFVLVLAGFGGAVIRHHRRALMVWLAAVVSLMASSYVFLEVWFWPPPVLLYPFRLFPTIILLAVLALASVAADGSQRAALRTISFGALLADVFYPWSPVLGWVTLLSMVGASVFAMRSRRPAPPWFGRAFRRARRVFSETGLSPRVALTAVFIVMIGHAVLVHSPLQRFGPQGEEVELLTAIESETPSGAVLLVPPEVEGVRLTAGRAVVVNLRAFPLSGDEILEWQRRIEAVTGLDPGDADRWYRDLAPDRVADGYEQAFRRRRLADLVSAGDRYGATHLFLPRDSAAGLEVLSLLEPPLWENDTYVLIDRAMLSVVSS